MDIQKFETAYLNAGGKASELEKEDGEYVSSKAQMGWQMWQAAAQAVPEGFVLVPKELSDEKADIQASLSWSCHLGLFKSQNRDMSATEIEEFRLKWCRNKARDLQEEYKAMIEAQEQSHDRD